MTDAGGIGGDRSSPLASLPLAIALIIVVAVATRIVAWWNPVAHYDDQFYLLAGQELLKGHWPYVAVWDRKPPGLFLFYAAIAAVAGGGILGLNLIATGFAAATALVIRQIALRFANSKGATLAALAYLVVIPLMGGQTGQSPVFYNLPMAIAGWLLLASSDTNDRRTLTRRALQAMLLCGLALTLKQSAVIEGMFFGLGFLWLLRRHGYGWTELAVIATAMAALALLPTALTLAAYAIAGPTAFDAYFYAVFVSIFQKRGWPLSVRMNGLLYFLVNLTPLILMAAAGAWFRWRASPRATRDLLLFGWLAAALAGYLAIPHFFDHYALPLIVPLSISAATVFARSSGGLFWAGLLFYSVMQRPLRDVASNVQGRQAFDQLAAVVERGRHGGCLYIGDGPTRLYSISSACRVTRYLFPDHLNQVLESDAVGVDTRHELTRILDQRPAVILSADRPAGQYSANYLWFQDQLPRQYRLIFTTPRQGPNLAGIRVWQRRDLARHS